jgi:hypothetical protein
VLAASGLVTDAPIVHSLFARRRTWTKDVCDFGEPRPARMGVPSRYPSGVCVQPVDTFLTGVRRGRPTIVVFNATGQKRLLSAYCAYYEQPRTHLSSDKDALIPRPVSGVAAGDCVASLGPKLIVDAPAGEFNHD